MSSGVIEGGSSVGVVEGEVSWAFQGPGVLTATSGEGSSYERPLRDLPLEEIQLDTFSKRRIRNRHFILLLLFAALQLCILLAVLNGVHKRTASPILAASKQQRQKMQQQQQLLEQQLQKQTQQQDQEVQLMLQLEMQHKVQQEQRKHQHHQHFLLHSLLQRQEHQQALFQKMLLPQENLKDPAKITLAFFRLHLESIWKEWAAASTHFVEKVFAISKAFQAGEFQEAERPQKEGSIQQLQEALENLKSAAKAFAKAKRFWEAAARERRLLKDRPCGDEEASAVSFFLDRVSSAQKYALRYLDWLFKKELQPRDGSSGSSSEPANGGSLSLAAFLEAVRQAQALKVRLPEELQLIPFLEGPFELLLASQETLGGKKVSSQTLTTASLKTSSSASPKASSETSPKPSKKSDSPRSLQGPAQRYLRRRSSSSRPSSPPAKVDPTADDEEEDEDAF